MIEGQQVRRGVISYYAGRALATAHDLPMWQRHITALSQKDLQDRVITPFYQPGLQLWGKADFQLP